MRPIDPRHALESPTVRIRYAAKTDVGMKRSHNEDHFALIEDEQLFLVADGMGGHACGEVASQLSAEVIGEFFEHSKDQDATWPFRYDHNLTYIENRFAASVRLANSRIYQKSQSHPGLRGQMNDTIRLFISENACHRFFVFNRNTVKVKRLMPGDAGKPRILKRYDILTEEVEAIFG